MLQLLTDKRWKYDVQKARGAVRKDAASRPLRKEFPGAIIKAADGSVDFILSTDSEDRSHDIVKQDGWVLDPFTKNPVVLWAHDHDFPPIARSPSLAIETGTPNRLVTRGGVQFTPKEMNPFGGMIGDMVKGGFLNTVSVGFLPLEWAFNDDRAYMAMDFLRNELLEFSVVPIPANREALRLSIDGFQGAKSAGIDLAPFMEWAECALDGGRKLFLPREPVEGLYRALAPRSFSMRRHKHTPAAIHRAEGDNVGCSCEDDDGNPKGPLVKCEDCGETVRLDDMYGEDAGKSIGDAIAKALEPLVKAIASKSAPAPAPATTTAPAVAVEELQAKQLEALGARMKKQIDDEVAAIFGRVN